MHCTFILLLGIRCVELKTRTTKFWRHQHDKPETYLSTIEAIYYFLIDYHELFLCDDYNGQYDNLLFFFCFMYHKIRGLYNGGHHLLAYKSKDKIDIANKNKNSWIFLVCFYFYFFIILFKFTFSVKMKKKMTKNFILVLL